MGQPLATLRRGRPPRSVLDPTHQPQCNTTRRRRTDRHAEKGQQVVRPADHRRATLHWHQHSPPHGFQTPRPPRARTAQIHRPQRGNNRQPGKIIARWPGHMAHLDVKKVGRIPNGGRLPCTGQGLVRRPRDQPHPPCRHRQPRLLLIRRLRTDHRQPDSAPEDKALHPAAQRQSRALPTHPGRRTTTGHTALPAASRQPRGFAKASPTSSPPTPSRWVPCRRMGK